MPPLRTPRRTHPGDHRTDASAAVAWQQCQCGDDRHRHSRQVRRRHAAVPDGTCAGPRGHRSRTHFGRLAHARRAFVDALKGIKKPGGRAAQALEYFKALYQVETLAKDDLPEGETRDAYTYWLRQQHSVPLLESFRKWLDEQAPQILPESLLGKAISYTRNQWTYLSCV